MYVCVFWFVFYQVLNFAKSKVNDTQLSVDINKYQVQYEQLGIAKAFTTKGASDSKETLIDKVEYR